MSQHDKTESKIFYITSTFIAAVLAMMFWQEIGHSRFYTAGIVLAFFLLDFFAIVYVYEREQRQK